MHSTIAASMVGCGIVASGGAASAAETRAGVRLVTICAPCHRLDGRNTGIASILRWEAEEIVDKMHDFRSNPRASNAMRAVSQSLTDEEIAAVADEVASIARTASMAKKAKTP